MTEQQSQNEESGEKLILEDEVSGSLQETLVLRGSVGKTDVVVLFSSEILDHWAPEIQAERLNEMRSFIAGAAERKLRQRQFSAVSGLLRDDQIAYVIVLGWMDIAS